MTINKPKNQLSKFKEDLYVDAFRQHNREKIKFFIFLVISMSFVQYCLTATYCIIDRTDKA